MLPRCFVPLLLTLGCSQPRQEPAEDKTIPSPPVALASPPAGASSPDSGTASAIDAAASPLPKDAQDFIDKRQECDHWRGEEAYDEERGKEIRAALQKTCTGSDQELAELRKKYKDDPAVFKQLADFEEQIEAP